MTEVQIVAGTVMAQAFNGKYVFLVKNQEELYKLPTTPISDNKTGLACIIEELKTILDIEGSSLDLYELTNSVVNDSRVPLFVFALNKKFTELNELLKENSTHYAWMPSDTLIETLENMDISGVPIFKQ
ncbi:hypothetical protein JTF06_12910 [Desemzia sp. RIT804]|uniref:hypothetical protein n=1 Tax=Desemzia sp. RIT 804 TaxID=2810209 RepID=UPI0019523034|nr:hypothetical protein [Desemzia sp. RIT 804]MBM6615786.1 hypothetical protein [Desemzia sp. RIT 804]